MCVPVCLSLNDLPSPNNVLFHLLSNAAQARSKGESPETMCSSLSLSLFTSSHDDGPHTRVVTHTPGLKQTLQYLGWHPLSPWLPPLTRPQGFEPPRLPFSPKFPSILLTTISPHPQLSTWSSCRHHTQSVSKHTCYASHDFPPFWLTEPIRTKCISLFQFSRFLSHSELPKTCVLFHWTTTHFARCKGEKWENPIQLPESNMIHSKTGIRGYRSLTPTLILFSSRALPLLPAAPTTYVPTGWCKGSRIRVWEFRNMAWVLLFILVSAGWGVLNLLKNPREIWSTELILNITIQRSPWNTKYNPVAEKIRSLKRFWIMDQDVR